MIKNVIRSTAVLSAFMIAFFAFVALGRDNGPSNATPPRTAPAIEHCPPGWDYGAGPTCVKDTSCPRTGQSCEH